MMRLLAVVLSAALVLTACGQSAVPTTSEDLTLPTLHATGSIAQVDVLDVATPDAFSGGDSVVPLAEIPQIPTDQGNLGLTLWGTKDVRGAVTRLTQAQIQGIGATDASVHVFFDASNLPVLFRDDTSGYSIAISNESTAAVTYTLCSPSGIADSSVTVTNVNGSQIVGSVSDGGSCTLKNANALRGSGVERPAGLPYTDISSLSNLTKLISAASYVAGFAFALSAILKFKQHKDNPTQIPVGTPIVLIAVAAALLFLPTILGAVDTTTVDATSLTAIASTLPSYLSESSLTGVFPSPDPTP